MTFVNTSLGIQILSEIEKRKGELVRRAETFVITSKIFELEDFGKSQLNNLLGIAIREFDMAVIINFIRYQIGRDKRERDKWAYETGNPSRTIGDQLILEIEKIKHEMALPVLHGFAESSLGEQEKAQRLTEIHSHLTRLFLGYIKRAYTYYEAFPPR